MTLRITVIAVTVHALATTKVPVQRERIENEMIQFQMALRYYFADYGRFPQADIADTIKILNGENINGQNPKKIVFIEYQPAKKFLWWTKERGIL